MDKEVKIPKKLSPDPVLEAVVEIRFNSNLPGGVIVGLVYEKFRKEYPDIQTLPIMQMPEQLRMMDESLVYQATHSLPNDTFMIRVGPKVLSLIVKPPKDGEYIGWTQFSKELKKILTGIEELELINTLERVGVRYINFFKQVNIEGKTKFEISFPLEFDNYFFGGEIKKGDLTSRLRISNNANVNEENGSIIDIDTYVQGAIEDQIKKVGEIVNGAHALTKDVFFTTLSDEYLQTFNPEY